MKLSLGLGLTSIAARGTGVGAWVRFGGQALRVNGMTLRVLSQAIVVEPSNG